MDYSFLGEQLLIISNRLGVSFDTLITLIIIFAVWELVWNGLALWRAAKNNHKKWFIVMLFLNDFGILEILYYFYFSKKQGRVSGIQ